jgi:DNA-binding MarR family transcriptional regulator
MDLQALLTASTDPALQRGDLIVLLHLHTHLDVIQYRRLKQTWLSRQTHLAQATVSRALGRLIARGYVAARPAQGTRRSLEYRLMICPLPTTPVAMVPIDAAG